VDQLDSLPLIPVLGLQPHDQVTVQVSVTCCNCHCLHSVPLDFDLIACIMHLLILILLHASCTS
jgi:hypothetical protein